MERERRCEGSGQRREWEGGDCVFGRLGKKGKSVFIHPLLLHSSASSFFFPLWLFFAFTFSFLEIALLSALFIFAKFILFVSFSLFFLREEICFLFFIFRNALDNSSVSIVVANTLVKRWKTTSI